MKLKGFWLCLLLLVIFPAHSLWDASTPDETEALRATLQSQHVEEIVRGIYQQREFRPVWTASGQKLARLDQFFQLLDDRSHGLHPEGFGVGALRQDQSSDSIQFDIKVTSTLVRYAAAVARKNADLKKAITEAIETDTIAQLADRLAPIHIQYARLRTALQNASESERKIIELNMDRWRELDDLGDRYVLVNVPTFELEVYEGNDVPLRMKVVVGTNDNETPLFSSEMKYLVFSPYWNIPQSILTKETLPKIRANPSYATRQNLEVIRVSGKKVRVIDPRNVDWKRVGASDIQLRQKPGPRNSLGFVKFMFPNPYNVYLHDTPANNLFDRLTRTFSHGCIRLEKAQKLAEYVLRDQPEWTAKRIQSAMHAGKEKSVPLLEPLPVHIVYFTAWVDDDGLLHLAKDVYGYDGSE